MAAAQGAEEGGGGSGRSNADRLFFSSDLEAKHAATLKGEAQVRVVRLHICICVFVCVCECVVAQDNLKMASCWGWTCMYEYDAYLQFKHRAQF